MYFNSRAQAGHLLADELMPKYRYQNCAVIALNDGGAVVGAQIAAMMHCVLTMLMTEPIHIPGEPMPIAMIDAEGGFTFNGGYSLGQLEEFEKEFAGAIEQEKLEKLHRMNQLVGANGIIDKDLLRGHNVILASDGINSGLSIDAVSLYLKSVKIENLIIATPFASVSAIDRPCM